MSPYTITLSNPLHPSFAFHHHRDRLEHYDFKIGAFIHFRTPSSGNVWRSRAFGVPVSVRGSEKIDIAVMNAPLVEIEGTRRAISTTRITFDYSRSLDFPTQSGDQVIRLSSSVYSERCATPCLIFYDPALSELGRRMARTPVGYLLRCGTFTRSTQCMILT